MDINKLLPRIRLSPPLDKNGVYITFSIALDNWYTLSMKYYPDYFLPVFGAFIAILFSAVFIYFQTYLLIYPVAFLAFIIYHIVVKREISCTINKQNGLIFHTQGGLLGTDFNRKETRCNVSEIKQIIMQRHVRREEDKFQVQLQLEFDKRLAVSGNDLSFVECQNSAEKIRDFLELETSSIKAMD
jgi:hypothetical protein